MLLTIALAMHDSERMRELTKRLVGLSMVMNLEFDIGDYTNEFELMKKNAKNINMVFMDFEVLKDNYDALYSFYKSNSRCMPVLVGVPHEKLCDFLIIRPIFCMDNVNDLHPEDDKGKIFKICNLILEEISDAFKNKTDNSVIYVTTRQESFAVKKESILYCQSDLKYTLFILDDGRIIRKLEKLQAVEDKYLWDFERVHQSFLVNPGKVTGIDKVTKEIVLEGDLRVPISRKYFVKAKEMVENVN